MAVIAVFNQKGGGGKTTTALNVSAGLAMLKRDRIAIDLDPQSRDIYAFAPANPGARDYAAPVRKPGSGGFFNSCANECAQSHQRLR